MPTARLSHAGLAGALAGLARDDARPAVVALDGLSGAGKTWLGARLRDLLRAPLVHLDAIVPGWDGLQEGIDRLTTGVLEPLAAGRPGRVTAYDWSRGGVPGVLDVPAAPLVLVEGAGSGGVRDRDLLAAVVWLEAPAALRTARLDGRGDAEYYRPFRDVWRRQETRVARAARTRARAEVVVTSADEDGVVVSRNALAVRVVAGGRP